MTQLCLCGCGRTVKEGNLYIRGHNGRGIPISESTKQKISIGHKGKPNTEEQKRKISKANKGKKHTRSTEYCRKMSVIKSKNPTRLFGSNNPNYKKPRSKETRRKISEGRIGKYCLENHPNWKGGFPKCLDCGTLILYGSKRCANLCIVILLYFFLNVISGNSYRLSDN